MIVAEYYGITLVVHVSVHPYFRFQMIRVNVNGFLPNVMCINIVDIWLGLLMGKFISF